MKKSKIICVIIHTAYIGESHKFFNDKEKALSYINATTLNDDVSIVDIIEGVSLNLSPVTKIKEWRFE